ncbi:30S ribosomal protein S5 [Candidatus Hodgkinia cicadicola]|nr:30S ribosomal protein S5 [Candidatus Hodgkinia cicadicola]
MKLSSFSTRAVDQYTASKLLARRKRDLRADFNESELTHRKGALAFEKVVLLRRVSKVVKGGRKHRYSALVVAGDAAGRVGAALAKAVDAQDAATKASQRAHARLLSVPLTREGTLPFNIKGKHNTTKVFISNSRRGMGNKASNVIRAVLDAMGAKDISAKLVGSKNPNNVIKAVFDALLMLSTHCRVWGWQS